MELSITKKAQEVYLESLESEGLDPKTTYLKVGAKAGGCSGWKFTLETTDTRTAAESAYFHGDVRLIVNQIQLHTVIGALEVGYSDKNLVEQGFVFKRLGTGEMCGCGESFTPINSNKPLGWLYEYGTKKRIFTKPFRIKGIYERYKEKTRVEKDGRRNI